MQLYLDLDGVFADFDERLKDFGVYKNENSFIHLPKDQWTQDQVDLDKQVRRAMGSPGFWTGIPMCKDGLMLWNSATSLSIRSTGIKPFILTALPNVPEWHDRVMLGKKVWIYENLPFVTSDKIICCLRSEKKQYAKGNVLVDDMPQNIKEWNQAGGIGVLHESVEETINRLTGIYS